MRRAQGASIELPGAGTVARVEFAIDGRIVLGFFFFFFVSFFLLLEAPERPSSSDAKVRFSFLPFFLLEVLFVVPGR